ncbi:hypothetical protein [Fodinicurvata sediminis]|uniref:hypothetical protein n=1 Tax=Fodinicurvata sediminis TaxID=1121832 RepID=UPI0003B614FB|nr:hypothetical protein [Fodinicurvata sediminis]
MYMIYWLFMWAIGRLPNPDRERFAHCFGWTDPRMAEHWQRARDRLKAAHRWRDLKQLPHDVENLSTEWTRLDEQRAQKYYRSVIHILILLIVLLSIL